jgi:replicative DNA helicase
MLNAMPRSLPSAPYPHSLDSERGLIGSLLYDPKKVLELVVQKRFQPEWIYSEQYKNLLLLAQDMLKEGKPVDLITISQEAADKWPESEVNYAVAATDCYSFVPTAGNASYYMEKIQEKAAKRLAMQECERMYAEFGNGSSLQDVHDLITGGFEKAKEACTRDDTVDYDKEAMLSFLDEMDAVARGQRKPDRFPTFIPTIDEESQGIGRGELIMIRGLKGTGKSLLSQSIIQKNVLERGAKGAIFTFEMPYQQYMRRLVASDGRVNLRSMKDGSYTQGELQRFTDSFNKIAKSNLRIYDKFRIKKATPGNIFAYIRAHHRKWGLDIALIDHLHNVEFTKSDMRSDEKYQQFSMQFKALCLELQIAGILACQENSNGGTFGSSQVETDGDGNLCLLPVKKVINGITRVVGTDGIFVDKWREGDLLGRKIPMKMEGGFARIYEHHEP